MDASRRAAHWEIVPLHRCRVGCSMCPTCRGYPQTLLSAQQRLPTASVIHVSGIERDVAMRTLARADSWPLLAIGALNSCKLKRMDTGSSCQSAAAAAAAAAATTAQQRSQCRCAGSTAPTQSSHARFCVTTHCHATCVRAHPRGITKRDTFYGTCLSVSVYGPREASAAGVRIKWCSGKDPAGMSSARTISTASPLRIEALSRTRADSAHDNVEVVRFCTGAACSERNVYGTPPRTAGAVPGRCPATPWQWRWRWRRQQPCTRAQEEATRSSRVRPAGQPPVHAIHV